MTLQVAEGTFVYAEPGMVQIWSITLLFVLDGFVGSRRVLGLWREYVEHGIPIG